MFSSFKAAPRLKRDLWAAVIGQPSDCETFHKWRAVHVCSERREPRQDLKTVEIQLLVGRFLALVFVNVGSIWRERLPPSSCLSRLALLSLVTAP